MTREEQTSTGLGDGIAMPHSKNIVVDKPAVLFAKSNKGVDYKALDGQPTDLFFMIAAPQGANDTHLAALAELSQYLLKDGFADKLRAAATPEAVIAVLMKRQQLKKKWLLQQVVKTLSLLLQLVRQELLTLIWQKRL